jgi:hypothetical protein
VLGDALIHRNGPESGQRVRFVFDDMSVGGVDDVEDHVWDIVRSVLAHVDQDPAVLSEPTELEERLHRLETRICDAELAIGRVAVELLGLDLSAPPFAH